MSEVRIRRVAFDPAADALVPSAGSLVGHLVDDVDLAAGVVTTVCGQSRVGGLFMSAAKARPLVRFWCVGCWWRWDRSRRAPAGAARSTGGGAAA